MNSTTKTVTIALVVILILGLVGWSQGWRFGGSDTVVDGEYSLENGSSTANTNGSTKTTTGTNKTGSTKTSTATNNQTTVLSDSALMSLMNVARIRVPQTGVDVYLAQGQADFTDSVVKGHVALGRILGKVPTDVGYDVFVEMKIQTTGPAVLEYVALFRNVGQAVQYTSAVSIGDRLTLVGITATPDKSVMVNPPQSYMSSSIGYNLAVAYLDRKNGEPMTTSPSLAKSMPLRVKNHILSK